MTRGIIKRDFLTKFLALFLKVKKTLILRGLRHLCKLTGICPLSRRNIGIEKRLVLCSCSVTTFPHTHTIQYRAKQFLSDRASLQK